MARGQIRFADDAEQQPEAHVADALAAFGLVSEDQFLLEQDEEFWLWPENEQAFLLWLALQTQWVRDMHGPVGLNYQGVEACMRMRGLRPKKRQRLFDMVQLMEHAALQVWAQR